VFRAPSDVIGTSPDRAEPAGEQPPMLTGPLGRQPQRHDHLPHRRIDQKLAGGPAVADCGWRGNPAVIIRTAGAATAVRCWKEDLNAQHRNVRAQAVHGFAMMKCGRYCGFMVLRVQRTECALSRIIGSERRAATRQL
jgi:hypothetical protein